MALLADLVRPHRRALSGQFPDSIRTLLREGNLLDLQQSHPFYVESVLCSLRSHLDAAFESGDPDSLLALHLTLRYLYDRNFSTDACGPQAAMHPVLYDIQQKIEERWINHEIARCHERNKEAPQDVDLFVQFLKNMVYHHRASQHPLFDFLERQATLEQTCMFFASDYDLNMRFFDLIAMAAVGTSSIIRREITQNLWDEAGCGDPSRAHTELYERLTQALEIQEMVNRAAQEPTYQSLAGYNLFAYLAIHRANFHMNQGNLAATELLDPCQYGKVLRGARRLEIHKLVPLDYYSEHLTVDLKHGDGWLYNVIGPTISATPHARQAIVTGVEMRLNTCCDYYDSLLAQLQA